MEVESESENALATEIQSQAAQQVLITEGLLYQMSYLLLLCQHIIDYSVLQSWPVFLFIHFQHSCILCLGHFITQLLWHSPILPCGQSITDADRRENTLHFYRTS